MKDYRQTNYKSKALTIELLDPRNNNILNKMNNIKDCFKEYYENLHSQPRVASNEETKSLLSSLQLPTLTQDQK